MSDIDKIGSPDLVQIVQKAQQSQAAGGTLTLSTGEAVAAALVLNRPDWLAKMGYTLAEALERIGPDSVRLIPAAERQVHQERQEAAYAEAERLRQEQLTQIRDRQAADQVVEFNAKLITSADAPGYRDVCLTFDLTPVGEGSGDPIRASVHISPHDGERIVRHIVNVHRFAWDRSGGHPIDAEPRTPPKLDHAVVASGADLRRAHEPAATAVQRARVMAVTAAATAQNKRIDLGMCRCQRSARRC